MGTWKGTFVSTITINAKGVFAMILYSHLWDLILKVTLLAALFVVAVPVLHVDESLGLWPMIGILVILWLVIYRQGLSTIASWLYARVNLGADVSLAEARQLSRLFQLDLSGKWIPLNEVRRLPKGERRNALLAALAAQLPQRKAMLV